MEEIKRPENVNVEDFINEFVEYFGGQVISKNEQNLVDSTKFNICTSIELLWYNEHLCF